MVRPPWFDRLTMRALLIAVAIATWFAHAAPLLADEVVSFRIGPATIAAPESWLTLKGFQQFENVSLYLTPPLSQVDGFEGINTTGLLSGDIQLRYDTFGIGDDWEVGGALAKTEESLGIASPENAALAFESVPFDRLYGSVVTNFGKSGVTALYLLGSVPMGEHGTVAVGAVIPQDSDPPERFYTIAFLLDLDGNPFVVRITIKATRKFGPADLGWVKLASAIARGRHEFAN